MNVESLASVTVCFLGPKVLKEMTIFGWGGALVSLVIGAFPMTSFIVKNPFALALFWVMGPRESISYHTDRYDRYIPYWSLKPHRSPCVLFLFKYRSYWVVSAIPDEISCFGRKNHTGLEHDFQIKKKEKFSDPVSLSSFSNILTYSLSLCCYRCQKVTATLPDSHFGNILLLPLLLLR